MKENKDGTRSASSLLLILDNEDFKGDISFEALFGNLVKDLLPSFQDEEADSADAHGNINGNDVLPNGNMRAQSDASKFSQALSAPLFPEVDALLSLFKDSFRELVDLRKQLDSKLFNLKKEVSAQDAKHRKTLAELEKGVDGLFNSFARLDARISSVGQTAAKIGDHLQKNQANLILSESHLNNTLRILSGVETVSLVRIPPMEIRGVLPMHVDHWLQSLTEPGDFCFLSPFFFMFCE
ncbi:hypothetical protein SLE2022_028660 [Rubroshorea leprosula]